MLAHVVRCFEDSNILHVDEGVDPIRDLETIRTELILADLQTVEKRLRSVGKKTKSVAVQAMMRMRGWYGRRSCLQTAHVCRVVFGCRSTDSTMPSLLAVL